ncbi:hypothetical protein SAY87_022987 [Trapa incisa]|uniref:Pentatricopeptide repeat-containing protein n=1 Tax=Trapa incisa TaxID=236973 RepID=A0AAN7Q513_9MYRT|nr:hypothetical protein SAY87_022987 [Trapa incisa]
MYSAPPTILRSTLSDSLVLTLQSCRLTTRLLQSVHAQILINDLLCSAPLLDAFTSSCFRSHCSHYASLFLRSLPDPQPSLWNSSVCMSLQSEKFPSFFELYGGMLLNGVSPRKTTLSAVLRSCAAHSATRFGEAFHSYILKVGYDSDVILQTGVRNSERQS